MTTSWQNFTAKDPQEAEVLLKKTFEKIYRTSFSQTDLLLGVSLNPKLGFHVEHLKLVEPFVTAYVLTPWMLSHIFLPLKTPGLVIPEDWHAEKRQNQPYEVIGPLIEFRLGEQNFKAHLNYHRDLGHYLIQPLVQSMGQYATAEEAFDAWQKVLEFRQAQYAKICAEKEAQQEAALAQKGQVEDPSRRAFLSRWL